MEMTLHGTRDDWEPGSDLEQASASNLENVIISRKFCPIKLLERSRSHGRRPS